MKLPASEWGTGWSGRGRAGQARDAVFLSGSQVGRRGYSVAHTRGSTGRSTYTLRRRGPGTEEPPPQGLPLIFCPYLSGATVSRAPR